MGAVLTVIIIEITKTENFSFLYLFSVTVFPLWVLIIGSK